MNIKSGKSRKTVLIVIALLVIVSSASASVTYLHEAQIPISSAIPTIPITVSYAPSEWKGSTYKNDTLVFEIDREEWPEWLNPVLKVEYRIDYVGNLEIYNCEALSGCLNNANNAPFVITNQEFMIDGNIIHGTLTCSPDETSSEEDEQKIEIRVVLNSLVIDRVDQEIAQEMNIYKQEVVPLY